MAECSIFPSSYGRSKDKERFIDKDNPLNNVKKIIGVMSGKEGVGKSSISVLIAKHLKQLGYSVGVLDADITGPNVPRLLGLKGKRAVGTEQVMLPVETSDGIKVMSLNFLTEKEDDLVTWKGPMISDVVEQFWTNVFWGDLDYLVIDMPPGACDVALTAMQSIPINGIVVVSVPEDLVYMIVSKVLNMSRKVNINVLGVIENMSYITCSDCSKKAQLFNEEKTEEFVDVMNSKLLEELSMLNSISSLEKYGYGSANEGLELIFNPIVTNIIKNLEG